MIPALFSGIRRQIVGTAQRKVRGKIQRRSRAREWERERDSLCQALPPPCLSPARVCFSHFFLLNDFSPLSWSLEQAKRERERRGKKPTSLPLPFFHFFLSALLFCATLRYLNTWNRPAREETPRSRKKKILLRRTTNTKNRWDYIQYNKNLQGAKRNHK